MSYENWKKRLEIAKLPTVAARRAAIAPLKINFMQPGLDDEGYYRKPLVEPALNAQGQPNGQKKVIGWVPVAYFRELGTDQLWGIIGAGANSRDMTLEEIEDSDLWSWAVANPISYETYVAVVEQGQPWPDLAPAATTIISHADNGEEDMRDRAEMNREAVCARCGGDGYINVHENLPDEPCPKCNAGAPSGAERVRAAAANRTIERTDNLPPPEEVIPPHVAQATAIDNACGAAPTKVTSEAEAAIALGSKNRIAELRLQATRDGEATYKPPYNEYKRLHALWNPPVVRAEAKEKEIERMVKTFRESERKRIAAENEAAAREKAAIAEKAQAVADRAIAAGRPEPTPVVVEVVPGIDQDAMTPPAKLVPIAPTYGTRKLKEPVLWHLDEITDYHLVYDYFKDTEVVQTFLKTLATAAVKAGRTVPGTKTHEGII